MLNGYKAVPVSAIGNEGKPGVVMAKVALFGPAGEVGLKVTSIVRLEFAGTVLAPNVQATPFILAVNTRGFDPVIVRLTLTAALVLFITVICCAGEVVSLVTRPKLR